MLGYAGFLLAALICIFRQFIFSSLMFLSYDVVQYGLWQRTLLKSFLATYHSIPLWDPYILCGLPYPESIHGGIFYPLSFIDYLGYLPRMIGFNFIFHFWLAGLFAYLAARQFKLSRIGGAIAATAYALSPLVLSWVAPGHEGKIYCAAFFPLLMLFLDRIFERSGYWPAIFAGLTYGIIIVTPHLQVAYYVAWCIAGFSIYRAIQMGRDKQKVRAVVGKLALVGGAVCLALLLSAVQWLPSSEYITKYSPRSIEERGVKFASNFNLHAEEMVAMIIPDFCGVDQLPYDRSYWGRNPFRDNSDSPGPIVAVLAVLGVALASWRRKGWWLISAAIVITYSLGTSTPFFGPLVSVVPFLDSMRAPTTSMFLAIFSLAMLAGLGADAVLDGSTSLGHRGRKFASGLLVAVPVTLLAAAAALSALGMKAITFYAGLLYPELLQPGNLKYEHAVSNLPSLQSGMWVATVTVTVLSGLLLVVMRRPKYRILALGATILMVIASSWFIQRCILLGDPRPLTDPNPISEYLAAHCGVQRAMPLNISINQVKIGYPSIPTQVGFHSRGLVWFYQLLGGQGSMYYKDPRLLNLAGVRYIVGTVGKQQSLAELGIEADTIMTYGDHVLYENKSAFPRAFLVDRYMVGPNLQAIQEEVRFGRTDLRRKAILEERGSLPILPADDSTADARITFYSPDSVEVTVQCRSPQLLILSDNWHPYWHARVDGAEQVIHRAYGTFRAVELPAGSRKVVFAYHSPIFTLGKYLSIAGLLVLAGILGTGGWLRRRSTKVQKNKATSRGGGLISGN